MAPKLLYHYTGGPGLLGITSTMRIWATDARYLNDAQELRFGLEEMYRALMDRADELNPEGNDLPEDAAEEQWIGQSRGTMMRSAAGQLKPGSGPFLADGSPGHATYVACFCEEGDLLSQWRGYGTDGGFALGFSPDALRAAEVEEDGSTVRLVQVAYGEAAIPQQIKNVLKDVAPIPVGHPGVKGFMAGRNIVLPALAQLKDAGFSEEREWRLIVPAEPASEHIRFRPGAIMPTPYIELQLPWGSLRRVIVGPGAHQELRVASTRRLLASVDPETEIEVVASVLPFRG